MSEQLQELIGLETDPISVKFHDTRGSTTRAKTEKSGCT